MVWMVSQDIRDLTTGLTSLSGAPFLCLVCIVLAPEKHMYSAVLGLATHTLSHILSPCKRVGCKSFPLKSQFPGLEMAMFTLKTEGQVL